MLSLSRRRCLRLLKHCITSGPRSSTPCSPALQFSTFPASASQVKDSFQSLLLSQLRSPALYRQSTISLQPELQWLESLRSYHHCNGSVIGKPVNLGQHGPKLPLRRLVGSHQHGQVRQVSDGPLSWASKLRRSVRVGAAAKAADATKSRAAAALDSVTGAGARYRDAITLQVEAFWKRNSLALYGAIGLAVALILWRIMFGIASLFVNLSERVANLGFLSLSFSSVLLLGLYLRRRTTINPDAVYRLAMRQLNTFPAALEVMGAPLTGSEVRAYVMSGGGLRVRGLFPRFSTRRAYLIFPVRGAERRGLVSVETKKKKGKYEFKLLAVDVPTASGQEQRLYLIGDAAAYQKAGGLVSELRDPIIKAMASQKEFEEEDEREEEEELRREEEQLERELAEKLAKEEAEADALRAEMEAERAAAARAEAEEKEAARAEAQQKEAGGVKS